jgi:hypothetical protein
MEEIVGAAERLIFVSHSGQDTWVAKQIAREIAARGATPFLDEAHVDAGADFEEDILYFLQRAHELVVLLTRGRWIGRTFGPRLVLPGDAAFRSSPSCSESQRQSCRTSQVSPCH